MTTRVLHVIAAHSLGGASRSLVAMAGATARHSGTQHRIASLARADVAAVNHAAAHGLDVEWIPDPAGMARAIADADLVQVHFWNTPELARFLQAPWPPMRALLWAHVAGDTPPHVITEHHVDWADAVVGCCRYTATIPLFASQGDPARRAKCSIVVGVTDVDRVKHVRPEPHDGCVVGYVGTVDFAKMDRRFVAMHAAVEALNVRVRVHGSGDGFRVLARQAAASRCPGRFELMGYAHDVGAAFAAMDVFGYPLAEGTSSATELVLQEAMHAGLPPVVFRRGGPQLMVEHGVTGFVVDTEREYIEAIEHLARDADDRRRLGQGARLFARDEFDPDRAARALDALYARLLRAPKREHVWPRPPVDGAALFIGTLGGRTPEFGVSRGASDASVLMDADASIRRLPEVMTSAGGGGVVHYRRAYPDDPHLRLWTGLTMLTAGRPALAAAEFRAAIDRGLTEWRVFWYLAEAALAAGAADLADEALGTVVREAPAFEPAQRLAAARFGTGR